MRDLLLMALQGRPTPRRPVWLMRQAGRMLPEYRDLRARYSFEELTRDPELAAEVTLMPVRRFPFDAAIVFADLMSPVAALGIEVEFAPGPVVSRPLRQAADLRALRDPAPEQIAPEVIETLRLVTRELDGRIPVLGFAGGPWSIAAYLVQGEGKRDFPALRALAVSAPELLEMLLAKLASLCADYLVEQVRAGASAVQIFETWSGLLSRRDWDRIVKPHLRTLLERVGATGAPRILFLKDAPHLVESALELPAEALSVDWRVDLAELHARVSPDRAVQGNLDPAILLGGPEITRQATRRLLRRVPSRGHVFNLGHGVLPDTPLASVEALIKVVHEEADNA